MFQKLQKLDLTIKNERFECQLRSFPFFAGVVHRALPVQIHIGGITRTTSSSVKNVLLPFCTVLSEIY